MAGTFRNRPQTSRTLRYQQWDAFPLVLSVAQRSRRAPNLILRMLRLRPPGYAQHERFW